MKQQGTTERTQTAERVTMNTSTTSTVSLDKKIQALSVLANVNQEWAKKFCGLWDMSIPLAVCVQLEWVTELSDKGVDEINRCFVALSEVFEKTEEEMLAYLEESQ